MNYRLVLRLVAKDWYMSRLPLSCVAIGGAVSIVMIVQRDAIGFAGLVSSLIAVIMVSVIVPQVTVVNERKNKNLAFVMSLPISPLEFTASKVLGNLSAVVVPWALIAGTVIVLLWRSPEVNGGFMPFAIIAALMPLVSFSLLTSVAIVSESEFWSMITMGASNVSYSFWWVVVNAIPGMREDFRSPVPIWSDAAVTIIAIEIGICVLALALTFLLQSRKRSFV